MKKRVLAIMLSLLIAVTLTPMVSFGATQYTKTKDLNGREYYSNIVINPYTYYDVSFGEKVDVDQKIKQYVVSTCLLSDWVDIANFCFENAGKSASIWGSNYEKVLNSSSTNGYKGDVRDFLKSTEPKSHGKVRHDNMRSTGLRVAGNLADVRQKMADEIAAGINRKPCKASGILSQGPDDDGSLPQLNNSEHNDAVYNIVTSVDQFTACEYKYSSLGICFYDFEINPIIADDLPYITDGDAYGSAEEAAKHEETGVKYSENSKGATYSGLTTNETKDDAVMSVEYNDEVTDSVTNTVSKNETVTYGQKINWQNEWGGDAAFWKSILNVEFSFEEAYGKGEEHSTTNTKTKAFKNSASPNVPANTELMVKADETDRDVTTGYDTPVDISCKVAMFTMTGKVYADNVSVCTHKTAGYEHGYFINIMGAGNNVSGYSIHENLNKRAEYNLKYGVDDTVDGTVHKWWKNNGGSSYNKSNEGVDWNFVKGKAGEQVHRQSTRIPMLPMGGSITNKSEFLDLTIAEAVPLYLPNTIELVKGEKEYVMTPDAEPLSLDTFEVTAKNKNGVFYHGFNQKDGHFALCDADGKVLKDSEGKEKTVGDAIKISENTATKVRTVEPMAEGIGYIKWIINDNVKYTGSKVTGAVTSADNDKLDSQIIQFTIKSEPFDGTIKVEGSFEGCVGDENLNLTDGLTAKAFDKTGKRVPANITWEAQELEDEGIKVSDNGDVEFTEPGTFHVRACVKNGKSAKDVYSDWVEITAKEKRTLESISFELPDRKVENQDLKGSETAVIYELDSYITGYDQYGDEWEGEFPDIEYTVEKGGDFAVVNSEDELVITGGGEFKISASAAVEDGELVDEGKGQIAINVDAENSDDDIDSKVTKQQYIESLLSQVREETGYGITKHHFGASIFGQGNLMMINRINMFSANQLK